MYRSDIKGLHSQKKILAVQFFEFKAETNIDKEARIVDKIETYNYDNHE